MNVLERIVAVDARGRPPPPRGGARWRTLETDARRARRRPPVLRGADAARRLGDRRAQAPLAVGRRRSARARRSPTSSRAYERGGAAALSILTEGQHFGGSLDDLREARAASRAADPAQGLHRRPLPALRVGGRGRRRDPAHRRRARAATSSPRCYAEARALDLDVLVEVHDEEELECALEVLDADVIGINNRDLDGLQRRRRAHVRAAGRHPGGQDRRLGVGLSLARRSSTTLERVGVDGVLVGESLMRAPDPEAALRALTGADADATSSYARCDRARRRAPDCTTMPKPAATFLAALLGGVVGAGAAAADRRRRRRRHDDRRRVRRRRRARQRRRRARSAPRDDLPARRARRRVHPPVAAHRRAAAETGRRDRLGLRHRHAAARSSPTPTSSAAPSA